jgi:hypothetical protein
MHSVDSPLSGTSTAEVGSTARQTDIYAANGLDRTSSVTDRLPAPALVLMGIASVQLGAAFATKLFVHLGPAGTVFVRVLFAAVVLCAIWRPSLRRHTSRELRLAALFGLSLALMNLSFYEALDRIHLGIAVTLEFVGPLGVSLAGSRSRRDVVWALLAATGADAPGAHIDPTNNTAERAMRHPVLMRRIQGGSQSERGNRWVERIQSVRETCRLQDRGILEWLIAAATAAHHGQPIPSLAPT